MAELVKLQSRKRKRTARTKSPAQLATEYPLSVVIPARNAAVHLGRSLPALLANNLSQVEVLVVDDESDDGTQQLVGQLSGATPASIRLIRQSPRVGPGEARNRGLAESSHPYLLFLDADVVLPEDALHWVRESLDIYGHRPEVAGVLGTYAERIEADDFFSNYKNLYTCYLYKITDTLSPYVHTAIFCIKRQVLEAAGGFPRDLDTVEDFRLGLQLGSAGYRFIIDRRVAGEHLKRYTLKSIFDEDARRIRDLRRLRVGGGQRTFSLRAHRWSRLLSVLLPAPTLLSLAAAPWLPQVLYLTALLLVLFYAANLRFLNFCRQSRGLWFTVKAGIFLWVEMLWAQWQLLRPFGK